MFFGGKITLTMTMSCVCVGGGDLSVHFIVNTFPEKTVI